MRWGQSQESYERGAAVATLYEMKRLADDLVRATIEIEADACRSRCDCQKAYLFPSDWYYEAFGIKFLIMGAGRQC